MLKTLSGAMLIVGAMSATSITAGAIISSLSPSGQLLVGVALAHAVAFCVASLAVDVFGSEAR
jgi:hypothetical protein